MTTAVAERAAVPPPGCSRIATTGTAASVLTATGQSRRIVLVNPANSGGTAVEVATGGASGSGASRTMLTTAPQAPPT